MSKKELPNLTAAELLQLIKSNNTIADTRYTTQQYIEAIEFIQSKTYLDPRIVWGKRWHQILANTMPMVIKLLYRGYNDFKVFPISTRNQKHAIYDEETWAKYAKSAGITMEAYYGVAYQKPNRTWVEFDPCLTKNGKYYSEDNAHIIADKLKYLTQVGALARVCNEYRDLENSYLYSSQYIISKEKLRELVSLYKHTFSSLLTHTSITYTLLSSNYLSSPLLCESKGADFDNVSDLLNRNNAILPDEEQMQYHGRRIYSEVCSYWNEEKMHTNPKEIGRMTKQDYLNKVFGQNNWFEFDRRGSIYNLTYSMNKKKYLSNDIDIYELMNGKPFASKEERQMFKATQMGVYFSTARRHLSFIERNLVAMFNGKPIPEKNNEIIQAYWHLCGCDSSTDWNTFVMKFTDYFNKRKKQMTKIIGSNKKYIDKGSKYSTNYIRNEDSFIFQLESEVYLKFATKLRAMNIRVVQIYDGFYLENGSITEAELDNTLKETILENV